MTEITEYLDKIRNYVENNNNISQQITQIKEIVNNYDDKNSNINDLLNSINKSLETMNKRIGSLEKEVRKDIPDNKEKKENKLDKLDKWCNFMAEYNHILFLLDKKNRNYYCCTQSKYNYGPHNFNNKSKFDNFEDTLRMFPGDVNCVYNEFEYKIYLITKNKIKNFHNLILPKIKSSIEKMINYDKFINIK